MSPDGQEHAKSPENPELQNITAFEPSHREESCHKDLTKSSPEDVVNCTQEQFLTRLFSVDLRSVLVTNDPNDFHLRWLGKPGDPWKYFCPVTITRDFENGPYGNRVGVFDLVGQGNLKYAAFEVTSGDLPEQFILEVETKGYPTAAVISVDERTVHLLCRVDAKDIEEYRDRCELIFRMAHDPWNMGRTAKQIAQCSMPTLENGSLLYFAPDEKWRLPVPTKDFE